jgi:hypothetical protein
VLAAHSDLMWMDPDAEGRCPLLVPVLGSVEESIVDYSECFLVHLLHHSGPTHSEL